MRSLTNLISESKKITDKLNILFLSASSAKISKSSNSMFQFKEKAEAMGFNFFNVDPSISRLTKTGDFTYTIETTDMDENGVPIIANVSPKNTVVIPRRTVLKDSQSKDFLSLLQFDNFFCLNTISSFENCEDKYVTYRKLKNANVSTPRTAVITSTTLKDDSKLNQKLEAVGNTFPLVCKILNGTQGIGVFVVDSKTSLVSVLQTMFHLSPKSDIIIQEKIDSDFDLRVHVLQYGFDRLNKDNYRVIGIMQRNKKDGDFRTNFSLGATAEKGHLTDELEQLAIDAAKATDCRWCGVDIITDKNTNQSYVIEVNSSPGTKGITTMAGDDVVGTILSMLKEFKYTDYSATIVGTKETIDIEDSETPIITTFNPLSSMSKIYANDIDIDKDNNIINFKFNAYESNDINLKKDIIGYRNDNALIELDITFNGRSYKDELFEVLTEDEDEKKESSDSDDDSDDVKTENLNGVYLGSKFLSRIGNNITISPNQDFILTDTPANI